MRKLQVKKSVVITNCTNRKRQADCVVRLVDAARFRSIDEMARSWAEELASELSRLPIRDLYLGRAIGDAIAVSDLMNGDFWVVSAGLGLIRGESQAPVYDLTTAESPTSIAPQLARMEQTPADWWCALRQHLSYSTCDIGSIVNSDDHHLIFIALPSTYIELVIRDLEKISRSALHKLRIFTSRAGMQMLPKHLQANVMPYDERLETSTLAGTRVDYAQRAMRHFVEILGAERFNLEESRHAVRTAMSELTVKTSPKRIRVDDATILTMLSEKWTEYGGSSTRLLRYLRDEALVSCEQSRFRDLCRSLKSEATV